MSSRSTVGTSLASPTTIVDSGQLFIDLDGALSASSPPLSCASMESSLPVASSSEVSLPREPAEDASMHSTEDLLSEIAALKKTNASLLASVRGEASCQNSHGEGSSGIFKGDSKGPLAGFRSRGGFGPIGRGGRGRSHGRGSPRPGGPPPGSGSPTPRPEARAAQPPSEECEGSMCGHVTSFPDNLGQSFTSNPLNPADSISLSQSDIGPCTSGGLSLSVNGPGLSSGSSLKTQLPGLQNCPCEPQQPSSTDSLIGLSILTSKAAAPPSLCPHNAHAAPPSTNKPASYAGAVRGVEGPSSLNPIQGNSSDSLLNLSYFQPVVENGRIKVKPPVGVSVEGRLDWQTTLVGYFVGSRPPYSAVNATAHKLWGSLGLKDVLSTENGFFFFKFNELEAIYTILEQAPWHVWNRPLSLKKWHPSLSLLKEEIKKARKRMR